MKTLELSEAAAEVLLKELEEKEGVEVYIIKVKDEPVKPVNLNKYELTGNVLSDIRLVLNLVGVPFGTTGREYLTEAIKSELKNPKINTLGIVKSVYAEIASNNKRSKRLSKTPNPGAVERAIRYSIEESWSRGDLDVIDEIFGYTYKNEYSRPTNTEFIMGIVDKLRTIYRANNIKMVF